MVVSMCEVTGQAIKQTAASGVSYLLDTGYWMPDKVGEKATFYQFTRHSWSVGCARRLVDVATKSRNKMALTFHFF
jgi:hypothetical protein